MNIFYSAMFPSVLKPPACAVNISSQVRDVAEGMAVIAAVGMLTS